MAKIECLWKPRAFENIKLYGFVKQKKVEQMRSDGSIKVMRFDAYEEDNVVVPIHGQRVPAGHLDPITGTRNRIFFVEDCDKNRKALKALIKIGDVELEDIKLQNEILGLDKIEKLDKMEYEVTTNVEFIPPKSPFDRNKDPELLKLRQEKARHMNAVKKKKNQDESQQADSENVDLYENAEVVIATEDDVPNED